MVILISLNFTTHTKVDCEWTDFGEWTSCSKSCGEGVQIRVRSVSTEAQGSEGKPCEGNPSEAKLCYERDCPTTTTETTTLPIQSKQKQTLSPLYLSFPYTKMDRF